MFFFFFQAEDGIRDAQESRGLRSIVEAALLDTMYDLPSLEDVEKVVIDESVIAGQSKPLLIYGKPEAQQASGE